MAEGDLIHHTHHSCSRSSSHHAIYSPGAAGFSLDCRAILRFKKVQMFELPAVEAR